MRATILTLGLLPHIASSRWKKGHFFSSAWLIDCSSSLMPQPVFSYITFASFHCLFMLDILSLIFLTVICSSFGKTSSFMSLCHLDCFPSRSFELSSIQAINRSTWSFNHGITGLRWDWGLWEEFLEPLWDTIVNGALNGALNGAFDRVKCWYVKISMQCNYPRVHPCMFIWHIPWHRWVTWNILQICINFTSSQHSGVLWRRGMVTDDMWCTLTDLVLVLSRKNVTFRVHFSRRRYLTTTTTTTSVGL